MSKKEREGGTKEGKEHEGKKVMEMVEMKGG